MMKPIMLTAAAAAMLGATACTSGGGSSSPDEFRVVTMSPLTVPPEYKLRPPAAGGSLPTEVDLKRAEQVSAFGTSIGQNASASEKALVTAAHANAVNPIVRSQVDYEETKSLRKPQDIVDKVLFWKSGDSAAEDSATGGADIVIEKGDASPRLKLPGT
ncbi:MAG: DUF3035 domain-containing protein [Hyphomonas sp.]